MHQFRVLLVTSGDLSSLTAVIEERLAGVDVVHVTQRAKLSDALGDRTIDAIFFQNPLPWISLDDFSSLLRTYCPRCLVVSCPQNDMHRLPDLFFAIPKVGLQRTA